MDKHIEVNSLVAAQALIAEINAELGLPSAVAGPRGQLARDWIAGGMVGPPPPNGLNLTWAQPVQHPTQPERYSVVVQTGNRDVLPLLLGKVVAGVGPILPSHAVERQPEWLRAEQS